MYCSLQKLCLRARCLSEILVVKGREIAIKGREIVVAKRRKKLVITGFRDKEFQKNLEILGAKFGSSVSKKTFAVIVSSLDDDTGKADKARNLNVPLVTKEQFTEQYLI